MNFEKRHAFIKMFTRKDALAAKEGMEQYRSSDMTLRVCDAKFRQYVIARLTNGL